MRAPPEEVTTTSGVRSWSACSMANVINSPTAVPRLPPMKRKSITVRITGLLSIVARAHSTASSIPVFSRAWASRVVYGTVSTKSRGSVLLTAS